MLLEGTMDLIIIIIKIWLPTAVWHVRVVVKSGYQLLRVSPSVRMYQRGSQLTDFHEN